MTPDNEIDAQEAFARACFMNIEKQIVRVINSRYSKESVDMAKSLVKQVQVRSEWTFVGEEFDLGEYMLVLVDEELSLWTPSVYITGCVNSDGTIPILADSPRMFFNPQVPTDENDDEATRCFKTKFLDEVELELDEEQRASVLGNFAFLFTYGERSPAGDIS